MYIVRTYTLDPRGGVKVKTYFSESSHVAYQSKVHGAKTTMQAHNLT